LSQLLPDAEIVIVGVPLSDATTGLVDSAFLAALPDGALVVNIARGKVADTDAILAEARSGRLRFALDVTDPEPLPQGHPLFALPNVLVSPHVGGASTAMMPRMARLLRRQIERMLRAEAPENVVLRS
jgi:phosphoglycerate dehydrogenase-like enzyme